MPIEILVPRWRELITKTFCSRGSRGQLVVLDDVMPTFSVVDSDSAEAHYPRGEQLWGWTNATQAVAAQYPTLRIGNPSTKQVSPKLVVVETLSMINTTAASVLCIVGKGPNTATAFPTTNLDGRWNGAGTTPPTTVGGVAADVLATATNLLSTVNFASAQVPAGATFELFKPPLGVLLAPGESMIAQLQTFNIACYFQTTGYIRDLDPSELL